jgi:hypothetical protein
MKPLEIKAHKKLKNFIQKLELTSAAKSTKLLVACKQLIKTRNLSCVTSAVTDLRKKVRFED